MARFDRYLLSQLMVLFGFFSLVLVLVYWINRAVRLFDQLIADGQSASVFFEFTALSLPTVVRIALPLAAFAAAVYVTNRMSQESELVAVQATGYSPYRLARPVIYFGLIAFLMMSALMHYLVPASSLRLSERQVEITQNMTSRLLTEGQFLEPVPGLTFYVRTITPSGELRDLFLSDQRDPASHVTYTATAAYLLRTADTAQLVMIDGLAQTLDTESKRLFTTSFDDFTYNIEGILSTSNRDGRRWSGELSTLELLQPTQALATETNRTAAQLVAEGHNRFSQSLMAVVGALLGFSALLVGGFSRFGVWRQIVIAIVLIVVIKAMETVGLNLARSSVSLWPATYLPIITGFAICWFLLFASSRPYLFKRRPREVQL